MESKHTPGPWIVDENDLECTRLGKYGQRLYGVVQDVDNGWGIAECELYSPDGDNLANAHLIAAAPDMYEALQAVMESAKGHVSPEAYDAGLRALAKAEGR